MKIVIRDAEPEDAEEILALTKVIGEETDNLTFGREGISLSVEAERAFLADTAKSDRSVFLTACMDGKIVGMANYSSFTKERMAHRGTIGISILKNCWGIGIGSQLMERLLDFAKHTAKAEIVSLEVRSDNLQAIHLYEKFGFAKIGRFHGYFKINDRLIDFDIMEKIL